MTYECVIRTYVIEITSPTADERIVITCAIEKPCPVAQERILRTS